MESINQTVFDVLDSISPQVALFGVVILFAIYATLTTVNRAYKKREGDDDGEEK